MISSSDDMTSGKGKDVIANGWKSAGIMEALERGKNEFGDLDQRHRSVNGEYSPFY